MNNSETSIEIDYIPRLLPQAISDLIVCTITMPLTVVRLVELPSWNYGDTACVISSLAEGVNLVVSSLTACAIATDRLFMVLRKTPGQNDEKVSWKLTERQFNRIF